MVNQKLKQKLLEFPKELSVKAQLIFELKGLPYSLATFPYLHEILNTQTTQVVLIAGRQVAKTTTNAVKLAITVSEKDHFISQYIAPSENQSKRFSSLFMAPLIKSPVFYKMMISDECTQQVMTKTFNNNSSIHLTYAKDNPDRTRGIPADLNFFDEIQDMLWDCVFVVNEALSGSPYKMRIYAGTPKTLENTLESLWQRSSKKEWIIKCKHCGKYNIPCDPYVYKMITKEGFVCANCKKFLDVSNGTWHSFNRNMVGEFEGFHIPQVIVPRNVEYNMFDPADRPNNGPPKAWKEIWNKYEIESPQHFANEVLGISHSTGGRLISRLELEQSITLPPMHVIAANFKKTAYKFITAGVDWGIQDDRSRTVLTIVGVKTNGYIDVLHVKKYLGIDILDQISSIITLCIKWKVDVVGCDFGVGYTNNRLVRQQLGYDKIMEFQYCSMRTSSLLVWNPKAARYMLNRTEAINILFIDLKREYIKFPKDITPYFDDILAVYEEILESGNKVFRHSRNDPDDFLHSLNYANIAAKKLSGIVLVS